MRTRMWLAAVTVLGLIGCGGGSGGHTGGGETDWVLNIPHSTPAGIAECIEGPYQLPGGTEIVFDITDTVGDALYVSAVPDGASCDGSTGYGRIYHQTWNGSDTGYTGSLPSGLYNLAVACDNFVDDCIYTVDTFGYLY
jgi:hypothetical protein